MAKNIEIDPLGLDIPKINMEKYMNEVKIPEQPGISFGIDQTKDVVKTGVKLANAIIASLKDGKITLSDSPQFITPLLSLPAAISGIDQVPTELNDLSEIEMQELTQIVKDELEVDDDKAKVICEKSINVIYQLYDLVKTVKA